MQNEPIPGHVGVGGILGCAVDFCLENIEISSFLLWIFAWDIS